MGLLFNSNSNRFTFSLINASLNTLCRKQNLSYKMVSLKLKKKKRTYSTQRLMHKTIKISAGNH